MHAPEETPSSSVTGRDASIAPVAPRANDHSDNRMLEDSCYVYGLKTILVVEALTPDQEQSPDFASIEFVRRWFDYEKCISSDDVQTSWTYHHDAYYIMNMKMSELIYFSFLEIKHLREIAEVHAIPVPVRIKKPELRSLLSSHVCPGKTCAIYIFKYRNKGRNSNYKKTNTSLQDINPSVQEPERSTHQYVDPSPAIEREVADSIAADFPRILSDKDRKQHIRDWQVVFTNANFTRNVCASCSLFEFVMEGRFQWVPFEQVQFELLTNPALPTHLLPNSYDIGVYGNAILNPKGLQTLSAPGPLLLCSACRNDLLVRNRMPEFSLANWLYYAHDRLPQDVREAFENATAFELQLVSRACCTRIIHRYSDKDPSLGSQRYNKGSLMILPQDSVTVRKFLPPSPDTIRDTICALFVGKEKPTAENIQKLGPILIRKS
jgi:hypothetical protein